MKKQLKTVKASMIVGLLLMGVLLSVMPSSSAQSAGIFSFEPILNIDIKNAEETTNIVPADPSGKIIHVDILYKISGLLSDPAIRLFNSRGIGAQIQISVGSTPEYCDVFLYTQSAEAEISNQFMTADPEINLLVKFKETAPLQSAVDIPLILKATVAPAFPYHIEDIEQEFKIPVSAAYVPIIDVVPRQTFKEVGPGDIAIFEIDLENKGNAETEFRFDLSEVPDGWTASIISQTKISSQALDSSSKKTVTLEVRPPYQFGYHDEEKQIVVNVQGFYYAPNINTTSQVIPVRVIVKNRGFSFQPGIEMAVLFIVIIAIIIVALIARNKGFFSKK